MILCVVVFRLANFVHCFWLRVSSGLTIPNELLLVCVGRFSSPFLTYFVEFNIQLHTPVIFGHVFGEQFFFCIFCNFSFVFFWLCQRSCYCCSTCWLYFAMVKLSLFVCLFVCLCRLSFVLESILWWKLGRNLSIPFPWEPCVKVIVHLDFCLFWASSSLRWSKKGQIQARA